MLMRAQEQLLLEPEEELPDEADVEDGATDDAGVRIDVKEDGQNKTDESVIEELIRRLTHGPLAKFDGDGDAERAGSTQSDTDLQSSRVELTKRNNTLDKNYFSKTPFSRSRAPSVNYQNPPPVVAQRKTLSIDGKPKTKPARDGGKDTAHNIDTGGLRIQVADKKRQSSAVKDKVNFEVDIPLRRKRATTHLFFETIRRTSLTSSKGQGSRATLSAHTIATHLASEFSLMPMRMDSIQPSYQSLGGGFWPKPQRYYIPSNTEHCGESIRGENTGSLSIVMNISSLQREHAPYRDKYHACARACIRV